MQGIFCSITTIFLTATYQPYNPYPLSFPSINVTYNSVKLCLNLLINPNQRYSSKYKIVLLGFLIFLDFLLLIISPYCLWPKEQ